MKAWSFLRSKKWPLIAGGAGAFGLGTGVILLMNDDKNGNGKDDRKKLPDVPGFPKP